MNARLPALAIALFLVGTTQAHHSGSVYDSSKRQTWTGTLSSLDWVAPHILLHLDVTGADGKTSEWTFEGNPPAFYIRMGLRRSALEKGLGKTVKITGAPARAGILLANLMDIEFDDGTHFSVAVPRGGVEPQKPAQ